MGSLMTEIANRANRLLGSGFNVEVNFERMRVSPLDDPVTPYTLKPLVHVSRTVVIPQEQRFDESGNPIPVVLRRGTSMGKSTVLHSPENE